MVKLKYMQHPLVSVGRLCSFLMAERGVNPSLIGMFSTMCLNRFLRRVLIKCDFPSPIR